MTQLDRIMALAKALQQRLNDTAGWNAGFDLYFLRSGFTFLSTGAFRYGGGIGIVDGEYKTLGVYLSWPSPAEWSRTRKWRVGRSILVGGFWPGQFDLALHWMRMSDRSLHLCLHLGCFEIERWAR